MYHWVFRWVSSKTGRPQDVFTCCRHLAAPNAHPGCVQGLKWVKSGAFIRIVSFWTRNLLSMNGVKYTCFIYFFYLFVELKFVLTVIDTV